MKTESVVLVRNELGHAHKAARIDREFREIEWFDLQLIEN